MLYSLHLKFVVDCIFIILFLYINKIVVKFYCNNYPTFRLREYANLNLSVDFIKYQTGDQSRSNPVRFQSSKSRMNKNPVLGVKTDP